MLIIWFIAIIGLLTGKYLLVFALASLKKWAYTPAGSETPLNRFAIVIPVYKEDALILESAAKALQLGYHPDLFDVVVIADSLQAATKVELEEMGCKVVPMFLQPRSKAKALNLALAVLPKDY